MFSGTKIMKYSVLLLIVIVFTQVNAEENEDEYAVQSSGNCSKTYNKVAGKITFNQKNGSLSCDYTIQPNKTLNVTQIFILLEKMVIDDDDTVTIKTVSENDSEVILGPFRASPDAFLLITGLREIVIQLNTSKREVQREFAASYQSHTCAFTVHDDVSRMSQPRYAPNVKEAAPCEFSYIVKVDQNVTFAFSFEEYNLSNSSIDVTGALEFTQKTFEKGDQPPPDFLAVDDTLKVDVNMDPQTPSDHFVLYRHQAYSACSGFIRVQGVPQIASPPLPKLIDQDVPKECHWHFANDKSEALGVKFTNMNLEDNFDVVTITDGVHTSLKPLFQATRITQNSSLAQVIRTSSSDFTLTFKPQSFRSSIAFDVMSAGSGKYLKNNGTFKATYIPNRQNDTVFLLEVPEGKNVAVNFKSYSLVPPAALEIYEDFTRDSRKIATLKSEVWYPIMSSTSKLMIAAVNFAQGEFEGEFEAAAEGCMHMSPGTSDSYVLSGNCETTCAWIIPPVDYKGVLLLDLQYLALDVNDVVTVLHLDTNKTVVANITPKTSHVPQFSLDTAVGAFVNVTRGKCTKKTDEVVLVARANYLPDCSQSYTLSPSDELQLTSPSFPDTYPLFSYCNSSIKQSSKDQMLHLAFEKLELASDHCIQISYVSENGSSTFSVTGNQMPDDFILKGEVSVLFNSGSCNTTKGVSMYASKQGFLLNVTAISCGGVANKKADQLKIPANTSICIFKVNVPASETDGSLNFIIYSVQEGKSGNYKLQVHDGPTVRDEVINNNTEAVWSRTSSLIFVYKRLDSAKPSADVTVKYETKSCNKTSQCDNGICMHPDWRCNGKNDCGDYSDEKDCQTAPPHNDPDVKSSISPVAFGICIVLFFIFGIGVTLCTPWALQKYRNRYRPFQDLSVIE